MQIVPLVPGGLVFLLEVSFQSGEICTYVCEQVWEQFCRGSVPGANIVVHVGSVFVRPAEVCSRQPRVLCQEIVVRLAD